MNDRNNNVEPWDRDSYETGSTRPPKSRGGIIAVLLMAVIVLLGVTTMLGLLNVRLFAQSQHPSAPTVGEGMAFYPDNAPTGTTASTLPEVLIPDGSNIRMELDSSPESMDNVPQANGLPLQDIYEKNIQSVVSISCTRSDGTSSGTGVIFDRKGYIVTNCHVVEGAQSIRVLLTDGRDFPAAVVGQDSVSDLAVLYIDARLLEAARFGDSSALRVGDAVVAIGDPLGIELRGTMTDGIVSAINREVSLSGRSMTLIQTNAALNSGNSGGPLINCYGQVIGINTLKIGAFVDSAGVEGIGFAIPSTTVKEIVDQLMTQGYVSGRPLLGIECSEVTSYYQQFYRLPAGIRVVSVNAGGPAEQAGLHPGDIILNMDGKRITTLDEMNACLYTHAVGDTSLLTVYRAGKQISISVTLGERTE